MCTRSLFVSCWELVDGSVFSACRDTWHKTDVVRVKLVTKTVEQSHGVAGKTYTGAGMSHGRACWAVRFLEKIR